MSSLLHELVAFDSSGIPELDKVLAEKSTKGTVSTSIKRGDVIEIQGPSASGKTFLTYEIAMNCIMPRELHLVTVEHDGTRSTSLRSVGGWCGGAVILDCDGRWSVRDVAQKLRSRLGLYHPQAISTSPSLDQLVDDCMNRLHVFRPTSTLSLACTLLHLASYHAEQMINQDMALLVIDSISTFFWQDRFASEGFTNYRVPKEGDFKDVEHPLNHVLIAIQKLRLDFGPVVALTNWGLSLAHPTVGSEDSDFPLYRQHLNPFPSPFELPPRKLTKSHVYPPISRHITIFHKQNESADSVKISKWSATQEAVIRTTSTGSLEHFRIKLNIA